VQRPVLRRLQELPDERVTHRVGATGEQPRVGVEGATVKVGDGELAQPQTPEPVALGQ
jgi:hypothetical protein